MNESNNELIYHLNKEDSNLRFVNNDLRTTLIGQSSRQDTVEKVLPHSRFF